MKKYKILKWILISILVVPILWLGYVSYVAEKVEAGRHMAEMTTPVFLYKASEGNFEDPYELMSDTTKKEISYEQFKNSLQYPKGIYNGITNVELMDYYWVLHVWQGMTMDISYKGRVTYDDGSTGDLDITYIEENGEWKILSVWIGVEEERLKKFQK